MKVQKHGRNLQRGIEHYKEIQNVYILNLLIMIDHPAKVLSMFFTLSLEFSRAYCDTQKRFTSTEMICKAELVRLCDSCCNVPFITSKEKYVVPFLSVSMIQLVNFSKGAELSIEPHPSAYFPTHLMRFSQDFLACAEHNEL